MRKLLLKNHLSPGDIVMLTAAVRDLHRCHPNQFETDVRSSCPGLWDHNPHLTPLKEHEPGVEVIDCDYPLISRSNQTPYHCLHGFTEFLNERLNLNIRPTEFKGDIHLSPLEKSWYSQVQELTGDDTPFWIVVAGGKYDVTIKWWQTERYQAVIDHFKGRIQFVQVGERGHHHPKLRGVIDLRGRTDLRQLVRLVYHSQGVLCGVTALMHLAAAVEVREDRAAVRPCVVIAGGREPVHWEAYPRHQFLHTIGQLPCCAQGGCWKSRTVPLGDGDDRDQPERVCVDVVGTLPRCMDMITPEAVIRRIEPYFEGGVVRYLTAGEAEAAERGVAATENNPFDAPPPGRRTVSRPARKARTLVLQQASGLYTRMLDLSGRKHTAYAARHGLTFWSVRGGIQFERPPVWDKVCLIQAALGTGFELVVWLDADTLVVRPEWDVREALPEGPPIGMCRNPLPFGDRPWHYNAGVILIRNTPVARAFIDEVWNGGLVEHPWQEQARMNELGWRDPGLIQPVDCRWNSTPGVNPCPEPVILAWHGQGRQAIRLMKEALGRPAPNRAQPPEPPVASTLSGPQSAMPPAVEAAEVARAPG